MLKLSQKRQTNIFLFPVLPVAVTSTTSLNTSISLNNNQCQLSEESASWERALPNNPRVVNGQTWAIQRTRFRVLRTDVSVLSKLASQCNALWLTATHFAFHNHLLCKSTTCRFCCAFAQQTHPVVLVLNKYFDTYDLCFVSTSFN